MSLSLILFAITKISEVYQNQGFSFRRLFCLDLFECILLSFQLQSLFILNYHFEIYGTGIWIIWIEIEIEWYDSYVSEYIILYSQNISSQYKNIIFCSDKYYVTYKWLKSTMCETKKEGEFVVEWLGYSMKS